MPLRKITCYDCLGFLEWLMVSVFAGALLFLLITFVIMDKKPVNSLSPYKGEPYTMIAVSVDDGLIYAMKSKRVVLLERTVSKTPLQYRAEIVIAPKGLPTDGKILGFIPE